MEHILIIDDDKELCTLMKKCVEKEGWFAMVAHNGLEGLKFLDEYREGCVLIILDVMMPGIDGFQVLQKIRESSNVPVLMLTAKGDEGDKVFGLRLGADDYLTKPFKLTAKAFAKEQRNLMTTKLREHIKARDNFTCCICGNSIQKEPNLLLEIDHIIPVSKGGCTTEENLQTLCWKCNRSKSSKIIS